ncbi:MAG: P-II family nitrogen regulator [Burkholderiales bacterium]|nr:P-II family nitrogen regulator [Burkholderiales bacterium]
MEKTTDFCKVTAVIRTGVLERVEQRLQELGVHGICVTSVKGHGEYADFYSRDCMTTHARVEIFTSAERADDVVQAIMEAAYTGVKGDGIVAVLPVSKLYRIRQRAEVRPDEV